MDEDYFIRAMLNEPDNDIHRLLYADWLEENGNEEIASLIREAHSWVTTYALIVTHTGNISHDFTFYNRSKVMACIHDKEIRLYKSHYRSWFHVDHRGDTIDNKHNWAWLLSLGMKHGLEIS
jgi:uncharacterized protein (TIGR02996 family)